MGTYDCAWGTFPGKPGKWRFSNESNLPNQTGPIYHLAHELPTLIELARRGTLDFSDAVTGTLPLDADGINETMDRLERFGGDVRVVITP